MTATPALAATDLVSGYRRRGQARPVVEVRRLSADRHELTAVIGPNGSGKSTLLRTLVGAQPPLAGQVEVDGRPLQTLDRRARARHLAVVLTDRIEPGRLAVREVVALGRHPYTSWTGHLTSTDIAAAHEAAELLGIADLWAAPFAELSDGQRQRVMVARALAQEPGLVVLDEPTAYLDLPGRASLTETLAGLTRRAGVSVVMSTHDLDLALAHADRIWLVYGGGVRTGAPEDLLASGSLAEAFHTDGLEFDPVTATMRARAAGGHPVVVDGAGLHAQLAARAARRAGATVVSNEATDAWRVTATAAGWSLRCGQHDHRGTSFDDLARILRAHLPTDAPAKQKRE